MRSGGRNPDLDRFKYLRRHGIDAPRYPRQPKAQPDLLMAGWAILHTCVQRLAEGVKE